MIEPDCRKWFGEIPELLLWSRQFEDIEVHFRNAPVFETRPA
jgi:hypothetical protein